MAVIPKAESYKTKAGWRWKGRYFHPDHTWCERGLKLGHCKGHTDGLSGYLNEKDALLAAQDRQSQAKFAGSPATSEVKDTTLHDVCSLWLNSGPSGIGESTLRWYAELWRAWTNKNSLIGQLAAADVTPLHVSMWLGDLREEGLAQSTIRSHVILIRHILRYAVNPLGLRADNPAAPITAPQSKKRTPSNQPRLTEYEVWQLADVIHPRYRTFVILGAYTGLRLAELIGLRSSYLDRNAWPYVINVDWQWDQGVKEFRRPKRNTIRTVPITPELAGLVDKHTLQYPPSQNRDGLMFAASNGSQMHQSNFRNQVWYPALERAGLPRVTPHSLRRTFVDIMIDRGVKPTDVRDLAGHKDINVTMNTYKGTATTGQLSDAIMATAPGHVGTEELQQAVNAGAGIYHAQLINGEFVIEGLHPDWVPRREGNLQEGPILPR